MGFDIKPCMQNQFSRLASETAIEFEAFEWQINLEASLIKKLALLAKVMWLPTRATRVQVWGLRMRLYAALWNLLRRCLVASRLPSDHILDLLLWAIYFTQAAIYKLFWKTEYRRS